VVKKTEEIAATSSMSVEQLTKQLRDSEHSGCSKFQTQIRLLKQRDKEVPEN